MKRDRDFEYARPLIEQEDSMDNVLWSASSQVARIVVLGLWFWLPLFHNEHATCFETALCSGKARQSCFI